MQDEDNGIDFGSALVYAKEGSKIFRKGWNGKGMWVCYMPPVTIEEGLVNGRARKFQKTGDLRVGGYFVIMTANGVWQPGWVPSQEDMLASDWYVELVE